MKIRKKIYDWYRAKVVEQHKKIEHLTLELHEARHEIQRLKHLYNQREDERINTLLHAACDHRIDQMIADSHLGSVDHMPDDHKPERTYAYGEENCPTKHWNDGTDICADCGADLNPPTGSVEDIIQAWPRHKSKG